jgi:histidinol-phosphatase (PHP family)
MIDLHVHTGYCQHGDDSTIKEYKKVADERGIKVFGFSEHLPLPKDFEDPTGNCAIEHSDLPRYVEDVRKEGVLLGIEVDFLPRHLDDTMSILKNIEFNYIIGSVHFLDGWCFDYSDEEFSRGLKEYFDGDVYKCIETYFNTLQELVKLDFIDIVGHFDLIKKFNANSKYFYDDDPKYIAKVKETLQVIKEKNIIVEINTAGFDKAVGEQYPSKKILKLCYDLEIPISLGSDAHAPEQVGRYFDRAITMLKEIGYDKIWYAKDKTKISLPI